MKNEECRIKSAPQRTRAGWSIRYSSLVIFLAALCAFLPARGFSQSSNRWLLIFETSSSMKPRAKGVEDTVRDLLSTGMHGEIKPGDTIGIWTFSDKLHDGEAPLQVWSTESGPTIVQHTIQFLRGQQYSKSGNPNSALSIVDRLVQKSDIITVFLFTDSDGVINGTPFDDSINDYYKSNYRDLKKAGMPMVTVLRGERGYITTNTLNLAPWPVDIPPLPMRMMAKPAPKPHVEPPKPPAQPMVAPIILDGRKSENEQPAATNAAPRSEAPAAAPTAVVQAAAAAAPVAVTPPPPPAVPVPVTSPPMQSAPEAAAPGQSASNAMATASTPPPAKPEIPAEPKAAGAPPAAHPEIETATAASSPNILSPRNILIVSVAFTVLVVVGLLMSARRARSQTSLITRSFDRENQ